MSARLTTYARNAFISAVMDDVPHVDYNEQAREKVQKFALSKLPVGVATALKAYPDWFQVQVQVYATLPGVLANCMVAHKDRNEFDKLLKADKKLWAELEGMAKAAGAQSDVRNALRQKVKGLAYSCTTVKALAERAPEFAKYISGAPTPEDRTVPVVQNIVADLVAAGWPKGKKPTTRKAAVKP
jgi:hypothetical protein